MRNKIKKLVNATNIIDKTYAVKGRSMAVKPNIVVLFYAIANSENLSQRQLRDEWMLSLSTINTITTGCRNAGSNIPARMAVMAITTRSSIKVKEPVPGEGAETFLQKSFPPPLRTSPPLSKNSWSGLQFFAPQNSCNPCHCFLEH